MSRYRNIPSVKGTNPSTESNDKKVRYRDVKYPFIPKDPEDDYVYTNIGDRYDKLALEYYGDSSLWWIISTSNYSLEQDSLIPPIGVQIRIPSETRVSSIISEYEILNS